MPKRTARTREKPSRGKSPRCHTCEVTIRVPKGWSAGAATRKHYWAKHPEIMRGER